MKGPFASETGNEVEDIMEEFIARTNLEHYRALLKTECSATKRLIILKLIAEQEIKLAGLSRQRSNNIPSRPGTADRVS